MGSSNSKASSKTQVPKPAPAPTPPFQLARPSYSQDVDSTDIHKDPKSVVLCSVVSISGPPSPDPPATTRPKKRDAIKLKLRCILKKPQQKFAARPKPRKPTTFHGFSLLPTELQIMIIGHALQPKYPKFHGYDFFQAIYRLRYDYWSSYSSTNYNMCQLRALLVVGQRWGYTMQIALMQVNFLCRELAIRDFQRQIWRIDMGAGGDRQLRQKVLDQLGEIGRGVYPRFVRPEPLFEIDRRGEGDVVLRSWRRVERARAKVQRKEWEMRRGVLCSGEFWVDGK